MNWAKGMICAAALLVPLAAGCDTLNLDLSLFGGGAPAGHVLPDAPDRAALAIQAVLVERGLRAEVSTNADSVVVVAHSRKGEAFNVVLTRNDDGSTRARVEWLGSEDPDTNALLATLKVR